MDGPAFEQFAIAWRLRDDANEPTFGNSDGYPVTHAATFDGMNWEAGGESPIVSVTIQVGATADRDEAPQRPPLPFTYIG